MLWHGYLLGGTGSNVYTRRSRASGPRRARRRRRLPGAAAGALRPRRRRDRRGPTSAGCCRSSCSTATRARGEAASRTARRAERERWVERERRGACASSCPADLVFATTCCSGRRSARRPARRFAVKAHGSELEYSMRGNDGARGVGARGAARARGGVRRLGAHPRGARGGRRARRARARGAARRRRRRVAAASRARRRSRRCSTEARRDPPNPGNANERLPDEGNADRLAAFLAGDGRRSSTSGSCSTTRASTSCSRRCASVDARAVIVGFGDYREELERLAPPSGRSFTGPLEHRHLVHLLPLADAASSRRSSRRRSGWSRPRRRPPAARRSSRAIRGSPRSRRGSRRRIPRELRHLASFATGDAADLAAKLARAARAAGEPTATRSAPRRARAAVERWSWAGGRGARF